MVMLSAAFLSAQQSPQRNGGLPAVVFPAGYQEGHWVPVVALWCGNDDLRLALADGLVADGFAVVRLHELSHEPSHEPSHDAPAAKSLKSIVATLRQRVRIAQGGLHAVIVTDAKKAIASVLAERQEFQTVTVCGAAAGADLKALQRLPKRRVQALATSDAKQVRAHMKGLHEQRVVPGVAGQVHQVLDSFHDAAAVADEDRYFAILPDDSVFLGTDATERWTGKQFRSFAMRYFKLPSAWTYVPLERHVTLSADGKLAWFDEALDNAGYGECRGSGVLQKRDGGWVVLQYNLTVPVPNDLMAGVARQIRGHLDSPRGAGKK